MSNVTVYPRSGLCTILRRHKIISYTEIHASHVRRSRTMFPERECLDPAQRGRGFEIFTKGVIGGVFRYFVNSKSKK